MDPTGDTTCDEVDDDCDGELDEDCSFGPSDCPRGFHVIVGTAGDDLLEGTRQRDCILGYGGNDTIIGNRGSDLLIGGPGDDVISGGSGNDTIHGGDGEDLLEGGSGRDRLYGEGGNDIIDGGSGHDWLHGGECHDLLFGGRSHDVIFGDEGSDRIDGGRGWDHVDGGSGYDACYGRDCEMRGSHRLACHHDDDCAEGLRCVKATGICVDPAEVAFEDANCDGYDDDCDGLIDEDSVGEGGETTCGVGACASTGVISCVDGDMSDTCEPGVPAASDDTCDGVDDDCDGQSDEDASGSTETTCGVGACASTGVITCVGGEMTDSCVPGTPAAADDTCDDVDDDCDGLVDEDFAGTSTTCGSGACVASGTLECVGGTMVDSCVVTCEGTCDDLVDDDGDGDIDCDDSDCAGDAACGPVLGGLGGPCTFDSDCGELGADWFCLTAAPGGYCVQFGCSINADCPSGGTCIGGACYLACNPDGSCDDQDFDCGVDPTNPFFPSGQYCHPTCAISCPTGTTCDPTYDACR